MKHIRNIWLGSITVFLSLYGLVLHGQTDTVCFNDTILYDITPSANSQFNWYIPGGSVIYTSGNKDSVIVVWNKKTGLQTVEVTRQTEFCSGEPEVLLVFVNHPTRITADFDVHYTACAPAKVAFINRSNGADTYFWDFGNGESSTEESPVTVYTQPGSYEVSLYAKKDTMSDVLTRTLYINPSPVADFEVSVNETVKFEAVEFLNKSSDAVSYVWDFGDGAQSDLYEPSHSYEAAGVYAITLSVSSENGCSDSLWVPDAITVSKNCRLIFPNGFIPDKNGPTGGYYDFSKKEENNEIFHPLYRDIEHYELKIYNRWGELVFLSKDITIGWDGYYRGKLAPQDTYVYVVTAACITGEKIASTGSITLFY